MNYPYNDDYMQFDEFENQYILTEKALINRGIDLRARLAQRKAITPENVINGLLYTVSDMIYNYICACNDDDLRQKYLIANVPSLRQIIYKAMLYQAQYVLMVGNLSLSVDNDKRIKSIDENAKRILNTVVPELGKPITYSGEI